LLAASLTGCSQQKSFSGLFGGNSDGDKQTVLTALNTRPAPTGTTESPAAKAAALVEPAVVTVHTQGKPVIVSNGPFNDPFFQQFFGGGGSVQKYVPRGAGSGVIISPDGYIITNDHVVADAVNVTVNVNDKGYTARVIGRDPVSDIAVVKINPQGGKLTAATLGDSSQLRVGDWAIAVGNPLDVGTTVTMGIISAVNRREQVSEGHPLAGTIQTDAAINPGNSGGALANIDGQVIGINEAIASPTGSYVGIGFAIPMNLARKVAAQLIAQGKVIRPYLGIYYSPLRALPAEQRKSLGIPPKVDTGAIVARIYPNSPAATAGLRVHDVIINANGRTISQTADLDQIVQHMQVGQVMKLIVLRQGRRMTISVHLRERPTSFDTLANPGNSPGQQQP
jgi:serine protease Do